MSEPESPTSAGSRRGGRSPRSPTSVKKTATKAGGEKKDLQNVGHTVADRARAKTLLDWFDAGLRIVQSSYGPQVRGVLNLPHGMVDCDVQEHRMLLTHVPTGVELYPQRIDLGFGHRQCGKEGVTIYHFTHEEVLRSLAKPIEGPRAEHEAMLWEVAAQDCRVRWGLSKNAVYCTRASPVDFQDFDQVVQHLFRKPEGKCLSGRPKARSCTHCVAFRVPSMDWLERAPTNMPFSGDLWRVRSIRDMVNEGDDLPGYTNADLRILTQGRGALAATSTVKRDSMNFSMVEEQTEALRANSGVGGVKSFFGWTKRPRTTSATSDDPMSPKTPFSPTSPKTPFSPTSPKTPASPTSPKTPFSPTSPASPTSPTSPFSPASPTSPASPASPASPSSGFGRSAPADPLAERRRIEQAKARREHFASVRAKGAADDPSNVLDDGEEGPAFAEVGQSQWRKDRRHDFNRSKRGYVEEKVVKLEQEDVQASVVETMKQMREAFPLHAAATKGDLDEMRRLIERGAFVDQRQPPVVNRTPLHAAVEDGRREACELLVLSRADIALQTSFCQTPLSLAVDASNYDLVEYFLHESADPNQILNGSPLLFRALRMPERKYNARIVERLVKANADVNTTVEDWFPLLVAVTMTRQPAAKCILQARANPNVLVPPGQPNQGLTALMLALKAGNRSMARLLLNRKADLKARDAENNDAYWYVDNELLWTWLNEVTLNHRPWVTPEVRLERKRVQDELRRREELEALKDGGVAVVEETKADDE